MAPITFTVLLSLANIFLSLALITFAIGFFPYKPFKQGHASFDLQNEPVDFVSAPFDKLIFMVVDALRSDFVYSAESSFSFVHSLVNSGAALPFTAHASPPTVTMPKVKAMTTGSVPSFLDAILNFAESDTTSTLAEQDTWLYHLSRKENGKLAMYGDDTWLKLFPGTFARMDGTSSFFVSDFTEVDNNVTRHLPLELGNADWNGLILHFLGLDHIGHKSGPQSVHMRPKQQEMDAVVQQIFEAMESSTHLSRTLFVLCGDHGMNDGGNHGGSSEGETSSALLFISPLFQSVSSGLPCPTEPTLEAFHYYTKVQQSDIAPSLAALLGLPIPLNSLGVTISGVLGLWNDDAQLRLVSQNARQLLQLVSDTYSDQTLDLAPILADCRDPRSDRESLHCLWLEALESLTNSSVSNGDKTIRALAFCKKAQKVLSGAASDYDISKLISGIVLAFISFAVTLALYFNSPADEIVVTTWLLSTTVAYGSMMFASSFVEEEQQFWYWVTSAWSGWMFIKQRRQLVSHRLSRTFSASTLVLCMPILRKWNQTGQKWAGEADIARNVMPSHNYALWALILLTYVELARQSSKRILPSAPRAIASVAVAVLSISSLIFKVSFTIADAPELLLGFERFIPSSIASKTLITQARSIFASTTLLFLLSIVLILRHRFFKCMLNPTFGTGLHEILTIILISQSRTTNIPLFLLFQIQRVAVSKTNLSIDEVNFSTLLFQHSAFFMFGGSNAMSSIDLSSAYNGVSGYNVVAVGFLTFISNWAGSIWWASAMWSIPRRRGWKDTRDQLQRYWAVLSLFSSFTILCVMLACTALKTHLFVWTVFSPKYLYSLAWYFGQHMGVNVILLGLLKWLGGG